jgi:phosphate transport system permease protein
MANVLSRATYVAVLDPEDDLRRGNTARLRWRTGLDRALGYVLPLLFLVALVPIADVVYYIGKQALPSLSFAVITSQSSYQSYNALGVPLISTFYILALATVISIGLGLFGGIATAEFLSESVAGWIRMSANLLAGMPSVIVGYFGYFAFVLYFGWGSALIAGAFTLGFFMTPYIFRTADLAFASIPRPIREAAYGSGARPVQYILRVGTPIAFPQILTGVFLAMAIGLGETAPIILTVATNVAVPTSLSQGATYLTYLIWTGYQFGPGSTELTLAFEAALLIVLMVIALNIVVRVIAARYRRRLEGLYQ